VARAYGPDECAFEFTDVGLDLSLAEIVLKDLIPEQQPMRHKRVHSMCHRDAGHQPENDVVPKWCCIWRLSGVINERPSAAAPAL
jgi:hypothetical protein